MAAGSGDPVARATADYCVRNRPGERRLGRRRQPPRRAWPRTPPGRTATSKSAVLWPAPSRTFCSRRLGISMPTPSSTERLADELVGEEELVVAVIDAAERAIPVLEAPGTLLLRRQVDRRRQIGKQAPQAG